MNRARVSITGVWIALFVAACSGSSPGTGAQTSEQGGSGGGAPQTGGTNSGTTVAQGGSSTGGSKNSSSGGTLAADVGGTGTSNPSGGANTGGATSSVGGVPAAGGTVATGGLANAGGTRTGVGGSGGTSTGGTTAAAAGATNTGNTGGTKAGSTGGTNTGNTGGTNVGNTGGTNTGNTGGTQAANTGGSPTGGTPSTGGSTASEPTLITSAQNAFWQTGTLTQVTSGTADVTVNTSTTAQTWDGFGGTFNEMGWNVLSMLSAADMSSAMNLLFGTNGARFAFGRVPIGASDYAMDRYTLNETANDYTMANFSITRDQQRLIPYIKAALAVKSDIHLWASPWTPPTWMKTGPFTTTTGTSSSFDGGNMKTDAQTLTAHALYLAKFVEEYGKVGLTIEAIHPQNEPGYATRYPSCLWTAALYTTFVRDYLGPAFTSRSVTAKIYLGTMSNADAGMDGTIISTLLADSAATNYIKGFGLQWNMISSVSGLKSRNLPIVQTEHKCGNYPWITAAQAGPPAIAAFNANTAPNDYPYAVESWSYIRDWINAGVTSYSAWNMVLDTAGKNLDSQRPWPQDALLTVDTSTKKLNITPAYYVFRHFSQFVDPGAKVVTTTGGDAVAFKNPDGTIVAVIYNSGAAKTSIVAVGSTKLQFAMPANGWATVNWK